MIIWLVFLVDTVKTSLIDKLKHQNILQSVHKNLFRRAELCIWMGNIFNNL